MDVQRLFFASSISTFQRMTLFLLLPSIHSTAATEVAKRKRHHPCRFCGINRTLASKVKESHCTVDYLGTFLRMKKNSFASLHKCHEIFFWIF